jgi:H+-transporting ATPase
MNIQGLTNIEAEQRLQQYGLNEVEEKHPHVLLIFLKKFWAPIPWMLEITIILQLILGKLDEAIVIAILLLFNSILSFFQEDRANKALTLLKHHLAIQARVFRDQLWQLIPAQKLVPGDVVYLRMGDIAPADIRLLEGRVLIDQSVLTGEALPLEGESGTIAYAGTLIKRGEATGEVIATGSNTYFGQSVKLIQSAKVISHIKNVVFNIVKYLIAVDVILILALLNYAFMAHLPLTEIVPYILILLVASIPVALPATFTLATALGALDLTKRGVLVTRLSAIEDAAAMDIVCADKTGTITQNQLALTHVKSFQPYTDDQVLSLATLACDAATQDPIDQALLLAASLRKLISKNVERISFLPFDPSIKRSEVIVKQNGQTMRIVKGAPDIIISLLKNPAAIPYDISQMAALGYRILAVAVAIGNNELELAGLMVLQDPPREDSAAIIQKLKEWGLRIIMVTGDSLATAKTIASTVGIADKVCSSKGLNQTQENIHNCDVFAGMFPEDKFKLVKALQRSGHVVSMTGDGVNDAPALKQAEVGVAVTNATDVAKAAASIVLTQPGLSGILAAVEISRCIYQRMLTYTLNKIIKSLQVAIFLTVGVILTGSLIIRPLLIVLLLFTNDFMTMSIATDNVSFTTKPSRWRISTLMIVGSLMSGAILLLSFAVLYYGYHILHLSLPELRTLIFVMLVFTGQGTVYLIRERKYFWNSLPGYWLIISSILDIIATSLLASYGILMTAINPLLILELLIVVILYLIVIDFFKVRLFAYYRIH